MKFYNLVNYFKTKNGIFLLCLLGTIMALLVLKLKFPEETQRVSRGPDPVWGEHGSRNGDTDQDPSFFKINRRVTELKRKKIIQDQVSEKEESENALTKLYRGRTKEGNLRYNVDIYSKSEKYGLKSSNQEEVVVKNVEEFVEEPDIFAPVGRLLKCELVNTIDSCNVETPIIGIVTEGLYWNGHLIIPANTEVHGIAATTRVKQKIASRRLWKLVLPKDNGRPNGAVLELEGIALDREESSDSIKTYGITDGSFGISGYRIMSTEPEEIKMFIASFTQGVLSGLQTPAPYNYAIMGPSIQNTLRNASLEGTANVMGNYVKELQKEIEEKGFYTRVPAGKQFYLYVTERIEPEKAYFKKIKRDVGARIKEDPLDA